MAEITVRQEEPGDFAAIAAIVERAFGSPVEAELVRMIRESPNYVPELSLIALKDDTVVGHVMLSYLELVDGAGTHRVLTLSPVSVSPEHQRQGVGSRLIQSVLELADDLGVPLVCLEGNPAYYGRLGFTDSRDAGIYFELPEWAPPNAGQIYKLGNYDSRIRGKVVYPSAFAGAEELRSRIAWTDESGRGRR